MCHGCRSCQVAYDVKMAFTKKLKTFISEIRDSSGKSPEEELLPQLTDSPAVAKFKEHLNQYPCDPLADQEVVDSIEGVYYNDDQFDTSDYELKKLPEQLELDLINNDRQRLRRQLQAVSKKVSELVLDNHPAYVTELGRVMELQRALQSANVMCANSRQDLDDAKQGFTAISLSLLANYRKQQQLRALLKSLHTIKTLQRTDIRLREMLEEEDYAGAIQLCLECQKAASTFRHYHCISELSSKLHDTVDVIEESLDVALSRTCHNFDEKHYGKVQMAYRLLGKTQTAMDQLHMHFTSAIHNTAFTIVLGYVELCRGSSNTTFQKCQYADLAKNVTCEVFTACLIDLCKALWEVMKSYYKTMQWHERYDDDIRQGREPSGDDAVTLGHDDRCYIQQKLSHGLGRIWADVQQKVKVYLLSIDLCHFKYDEFIQVLDIVNRLMQVGEEFCGSTSEGLQESIRKQSISYFRNYHRLRMDELRMFLENEVWELCPVKSNFSILLLMEFKFLRRKANKESAGVSPSQNTAVKDDGHYKPRSDLFGKYEKGRTPFDPQMEEEEHEDLMETNGYYGMPQRSISQETDSDEDIPEELKREFIDECPGEMSPIKKVPSFHRLKGGVGGAAVAPTVTNTTLNVCRLFGRYMQMMSVLKPIAFDVILCMSQLFDYYLYAVYSFFAKDSEMNETNESPLSNKLQTTLKRIEDNLILDEDQLQQLQQGAALVGAEDKVAQPHLSPAVNLRAAASLFGLSERLVATESLVFLAEQIEFLQPNLEEMIPPGKKAFLKQFYSQTVTIAHELRKPAYRTVTARNIDYDSLQERMMLVKWDIHDIMSQHSTYVDAILQEFGQYNQTLEQITSHVPIPKVVSDVIWEHCIRLANRSFVEGYASAKKCTNEGRALMQLDFQQFLTKIEKLTHLRPIPDREFVEAYVKAYYLPAAQLEKWLREHKEYSPRQLIGLVTCIPHINKKTKQRLVIMVEEGDKMRR